MEFPQVLAGMVIVALYCAKGAKLMEGFVIAFAMVAIALWLSAS